MKKDEAERAIRSLCTKWAGTLDDSTREHPSFYQFCEWLQMSGYGRYLEFVLAWAPPMMPKCGSMMS
jgi:hypothetical protein